MRLFNRHLHGRYFVVLNGRPLRHPLEALTILALWKGADLQRGHYRTAHGDTIEFRRHR